MKSGFCLIPVCSVASAPLAASLAQHVLVLHGMGDSANVAQFDICGSAVIEVKSVPMGLGTARKRMNDANNG